MREPQLDNDAAQSKAANRLGAEYIEGEIRLTPQSLLRSVGGWWGVAESIIPPSLFAIIFVLSGSGVTAVASATVSGVFFIGYRLARRQALSGAVVGILALALAAFLALREGGQTLDFFLPGFFTNAAYLTAMLVSLVLRRPLLGYLIGLATGLNWRHTRAIYARARLLTMLWAAFFSIRLVVQVPLYLAENLEGLALTRVIMGTPAYAGLLVITWLLIKPFLAKNQKV